MAKRRGQAGKRSKSVSRRARVAKAKRKRAAPEPAVPLVVTIRVGPSPEHSVDVPRDDRIVRLADEWTYILRSRSRWSDDDEIQQFYRERALDDLKSLGINRAFMKRIVAYQHQKVDEQALDPKDAANRTHHVEVELHAWDPKDAAADRIHEAAADLPWEYLISAGTRGVGRYHPLLVTRLFRNSAPPVVPERPRLVLFVESAPGRIEDEYEFKSERRRIRAAVGADRESSETNGRTMEISATENLRRLRQRVRSQDWDVLHVTGVDTHQVGWMLSDFYKQEFTPAQDRIFDPSSGSVRDGMVLRESNIAELPVAYDELADTLINPKHAPSLVTLNLYYSGARTARELVKQGAHTALGFLDEIDDELAERFFQELYWAWCRPSEQQRARGPMTIPRAFVNAWAKMPSDGMHGTAIVIWMGRSAFPEPRFPKQRDEPLEPPPESPVARRARLKDIPIRSLLNVDVYVEEEVNYSLLHNDRPLLDTLTLTKLVKEPLEDISVQVELNLGTENYPFRCTEIVLDEPQLAMAPGVQIPLTATMPRSLRERVKSTVYTKVTCDGRVAHESTRRVTLIPVDEWIDDTKNNPWLPSFVLPRDPAILKIIGSARRYLVGIRDDPAAGFDGYQSVDDEAANPSEGVDAQVKAIWTAIVNDYRLQYINPPPAYSKLNQRLRTPSDILGSNSGTCIDLALLLASCLEYIDIYPVLVLLTGHAFVGYWRSEEAHGAFVRVERIPPEVPAVGSVGARTAELRFVDQYGWRLTSLQYDEIMGYVMSGDLVMLEATYLTGATSFADAMEEGRANMRSRDEFDSLLDIRLARTASPPVTPLPIISD